MKTFAEYYRDFVFASLFPNNPESCRRAVGMAIVVKQMLLDRCILPKDRTFKEMWTFTHNVIKREAKARRL